MSINTYVELGSNSVVRLHSVLIASRLNRMTLSPAVAAADGYSHELSHVIRSSLLMALSTLPLRDVVSLTSL